MLNIINGFIDNGLIQVREYGENAVFQNTSETDSSQISPSQENSKGGTENTEKNHVQQNEEKACVTLEAFTNESSRSIMNKKLEWVEIQRIKKFEAVVESKFKTLVNNYYSRSVYRTECF